MWIIWLFLILYLIWRGGELLALAARYLYYKKNKELGLKIFKFAVKMGNLSTNSKITYGYLTLRHGHLEEAKKVVSSQMMKAKKNNEIISAKSTLALIYWKLNEIDTAIELLEDVISFGENTVAYGSLGHMYNLRSNDLKTALTVCKKAYDYNSGDDIISDNYATILYKTGDLKQAKEIYKDLIKREPTFPEAYYNYGHLLIDEGNIKVGIKQLKKALEAKFTFLTTLKTEDIEKEIKEYEGQIK